MITLNDIQSMSLKLTQTITSESFIVDRADMVQEGILMGLKAIKKWNGKGSIRGFVFSSIRWHLLNKRHFYMNYAKGKKLISLSILREEDFPILWIYPEAEVSKRLIQEEQMQRIKTLLSSDEWRIIELRCFQYKTQKETAACMGFKSQQLLQHREHMLCEKLGLTTLKGIC